MKLNGRNQTLSSLEIAHDLGEIYFIWKDASAEKDDLKEQLYRALDEEIPAEALARRTVEVPEDVQTEEAARTYATTYNPGFRVVEVVLTREPTSGEEYPESVIIEQDPAFVQRIIVVEEDPWIVEGAAKKTKKNPTGRKEVFGYVVQRTIRSGSTMVDRERVENVEPELFLRVTDEHPVISRLAELGASEKFLSKLRKSGDFPRQFRDPTQLEPDDVALLMNFMHEGPKTVALNVRYANEDDLPDEGPADAEDDENQSIAVATIQS